MENTPSRRLVVILHADVVGSTALVRLHETLAHQSIQDAFKRFSEVVGKHHGIAHEIRGDALVAEFSRVSDAVTAAVVFQELNPGRNQGLPEEVRPLVRVGIAMGEVVVADSTLTGEGVVLAQRLEQLAEPGGVCIQSAAYETIPKRLPFDYKSLGERDLKGFDEPVKVYVVSLKSGAKIAETDKSLEPDILSSSLPDKPSIAVLPFDNMSCDPEQDYFADGMVEDIITDLSRFKDLLVIARNSSFSYKGKSIKAQRMASELGVRYVVQGSVRRAAERIRITAQLLIDALDESHLWGELYDRELRDVFAVQDEIVETIVRTVAARVERHGLERADRKVPQDLWAYDYVLQARAVICDSPDNNRRCRELYESALSVDPHSAAACCGISMTYGLDHTSGWSGSPEWSLEQATSYALKAVALDDDSSEGSRGENSTAPFVQ